MKKAPLQKKSGNILSRYNILLALGMLAILPNVHSQRRYQPSQHPISIESVQITPDITLFINNDYGYKKVLSGGTFLDFMKKLAIQGNEICKYNSKYKTLFLLLESNGDHSLQKFEASEMANDINNEDWNSIQTTTIVDNELIEKALQTKGITDFSKVRIIIADDKAHEEVKSLQAKGFTILTVSQYLSGIK